MNRAYTDLARVRIYLEGVLFPYAKSVSVTESVGSVNATIEVPPSLKLRPEEMVGMTCHIFYANKRVLRSSGDPGNGAPPTGDGWPIMFQGELVADYTHSTVESESVSLSFISHARHFEQVHMFFYDTSRRDLRVHMQREAMFMGNSRINLEVGNTPLNKRTQIHSTLTSRIDSLSGDVERNIAFSASVLDILRSCADQHPVFAVFDEKFRLRNRFAAYVDPDVKNILSLSLLADVVDKRAGALEDHTSLMQLIDIPTSIMKYNWNQVAQPSLRAMEPPAHLARGLPISEVNSILRSSAQEFAKRYNDSHLRIFLKVGEILLPADYVEVNMRKEVTIDEFIEGAYVEYLVALGADETKDPAECLREGFQAKISQHFMPIIKNPNPEFGSDEAIESTLNAGMSRLDDKDEESNLISLEQDTLAQRDELGEFTITPTMEFSHPPRCNVIMPGSLTSYGMSRNYMQEPTRLFGQVPIVPSSQQNGVAIEWYVAPFAQNYHKLEGGKLAVWESQYNRILREQENQVEETNE